MAREVKNSMNRFSGSPKNGMAAMRVMQFLVDQSPAHFKEFPGVAIKFRQAWNMSLNFIAVDSVEFFCFSKRLPVRYVKSRINTVIGSAHRRRLSLLLVQHNSNTGHTVTFAEIDKRATPTAAHIEDTHPRLQAHSLRQ